MAIKIPHDVALFLNFCGVPYPDIDEDQVHDFAQYVRDFAESLRKTRAAGSKAISDMGAVYSGASYEALVDAWAAMSSTHMAELDRVCELVGDALDLAAKVIRGMKIAVFAELAALACSYGVALGASIATSGLSIALEEAVRMAARRLVDVMEQMLVAYILSEVIGNAVEPLENIVDSFVHGTLYEAARGVLGVSDIDSASVLRIEPDEIMRFARVLDGLAVRCHLIWRGRWVVSGGASGRWQTIVWKTCQIVGADWCWLWAISTLDALRGDEGLQSAAVLDGSN